MRDLSEQQIRVPRLLIRPRQQSRPLFVFDLGGRPVVLVGYAGFLWEGSVAADFAYEFGKEAGAHRELAEQDTGLQRSSHQPGPSSERPDHEEVRARDIYLPPEK